MDEDNSWAGKNIYYNPKSFNAKLIEVVEEPNLSYEYNMLILVEDSSGKHWFATDSGCSCPTPFDYINNINEMTPYHGHQQEYEDIKYRLLHIE